MGTNPWTLRKRSSNLTVGVGVGLGVTRGRADTSAIARRSCQSLGEKDMGQIAYGHRRSTVSHSRATDSMATVSVNRYAPELEGPCAVIVVGRNQRVRLMTRRASTWLDRYFDRSDQHAQDLPSSLAHWIRCERRRSRSGPWKVSDFAVPGDRGSSLVIKLLVAPDLAILLLEERRASGNGLDHLTRREAEVVAWAAEGKTNAEIGTILGVAARTVQHHLESTYRKLGVENRTAAARLLITSLALTSSTAGSNYGRRKRASMKH